MPIPNFIYKLFQSFSRKNQTRNSDNSYSLLQRLGVETLDDSVELIGTPIIECSNGGRIIIGRNVKLVSDPEYNPAGINHPVSLIADGPNAIIRIGDNSGLSGASVVTSSSINIGNNVMIGANCNIYGTDFHCHETEKRRNQKMLSEAPSAPIVIEDDCWLCANVTVLKGVTIGRETIVGTMSLVNKSLPARCMAAGVPARVISNNQ